MDSAVALVQAYLQVNGYFTVTEYPVLEARPKGIEVATDLDVLAFRFPDGGRLVPAAGRGKEQWLAKLDPALHGATGVADMVIGEVKEGRSRINRAARNPDVLRVVLTLFGCCAQSHIDRVIEQLLRHGETDMPSGHRLRFIAFGASEPDEQARHFQMVSLGHIVQYLQDYLREHWNVLHHAEFKHPAFGFLLTLEKALRSRKSSHTWDGAHA